MKNTPPFFKKEVFISLQPFEHIFFCADNNKTDSNVSWERRGSGEKPDYGENNPLIGTGTIFDFLSDPSSGFINKSRMFDIWGSET